VSRLRRHARLLLAVYAVLLLVALFSPTSDRQSSMVVWLGARLSDLGFPASVTGFNRLEVLMNAVIIAPLTFLASLVRPSYDWRDWTALGFVAALTVEALQGLLLPGRHAAFSDIVANTLGALVGAILARAVLRRRR
jgi:glycopeptide antibiotics resistance protein